MILNPSKTLQIFTFTILLSHQTFFSAYRAEANGGGPLDQLEYPELNVVPRASARLKLEAEREPSEKLSRFLSIQIPALTNLLTGVLTQSNVPPDRSGSFGLVGLGVGGGWLVVTGILSAVYQPYSAALGRLPAPREGSEREQLTHERLAEESLRDAAILGERLRWISFATLLGSSIYYMHANLDRDQMRARPEQNFNQLINVVSIAACFAPIFFRPYWVDVYQSQLEYKKKIYAPVALPAILPKPDRTGFSPGISLSLRF